MQKAAAPGLLRKPAQLARDQPARRGAGAGGPGRAKPPPLWDRLATSLTEASDAMAASRGAPLGAEDAQRFGQELGGPLPEIRIHTDAAAHRAADLVGARAVTYGRDIYFAAG